MKAEEAEIFFLLKNKIKLKIFQSAVKSDLQLHRIKITDLLYINKFMNFLTTNSMQWQQFKEKQK
jgi:hypothetical protein